LDFNHTELLQLVRQRVERADRWRTCWRRWVSGWRAEISKRVGPLLQKLERLPAIYFIRVIIRKSHPLNNRSANAVIFGNSPHCINDAAVAVRLVDNPWQRLLEQSKVSVRHWTGAGLALFWYKRVN
jgi:hypothetical protein